jgi:hypothetical protein
MLPHHKPSSLAFASIKPVDDYSLVRDGHPHVQQNYKESP